MDPHLSSRQFLGLAWPAFITASLLELVVFALVDPQDLHWTGQPLGWSRLGVYTAGFFVFWTISALGCALSALLARSSAAVNACPFAPAQRPQECGKR